jgi:hypothetical protein
MVVFAATKQPDSERFRFVPRICGPPCGRLTRRVMAVGMIGHTSESSPGRNCPQRGFAMGCATYLGDFEVDAETNRVLDVALEMTRAALGVRRLIRAPFKRPGSANRIADASIHHRPRDRRTANAATREAVMAAFVKSWRYGSQRRLTARKP